MADNDLDQQRTPADHDIRQNSKAPLTRILAGSVLLNPGEQALVEGLGASQNAFPRHNKFSAAGRMDHLNV